MATKTPSFAAQRATPNWRPELAFSMDLGAGPGFTAITALGIGESQRPDLLWCLVFGIQRLGRRCSLFPIADQVPKLDAEGSNPFSRSIFSIAYVRLALCGNPLFEVTGYADVQNPLKGIDLKD